VPFRQGGPVLLGVHHDDVGGPQGGGIDHLEHGVARSAVQLAVPPGLTGAGEVIEHHLRPAEQQLRQVDVEVAQIADEHHIGGGHAARHPGQRQPAPPQPGQEGRRAARAGQHADPGRRVQA